MKYFVFIFSICFGFGVFGQIKINNNSLYKPSENIAYLNFANDLQIVGLELNASTSIMVGDEKINRFDDLFVYAPLVKKNTDTLRVLHNGEQVGEVVMKLETLKTPKVIFGETTGKTVTLDYVLSNPGLHISYAPQLVMPTSYISGCEMIIKKKDKKEVVSIVHGNAFSPKQIKQLSKLVAGDSIEFRGALLSDLIGNDEEINADLILVIE